MSRRIPFRLAVVAGLGVVTLAGCATDRGPSRPFRPALLFSPPQAFAQELVAFHRGKAEALERVGDLRAALEQWQIVLTISPEDAAGRAARRRLETRIEQALADRVRRGRDALARGAQLEARRQFLAALALDPRNAVAFEALRNDVKEVRFVVHTVRAGDTFATLAERYYGDRSRADVIADANQLAPSRRLLPGTTVRVPEIPGVPLGSGDALARAEPLEPHPLLVEARDALERGDYTLAGSSIDRLLGSSPQSSEALDLKKAILYGLGRTQFEQRRYAESYQTLTQLAKLAPADPDVASLVRQARDRLIQYHYSQGLRLYQEEKVEEAIAEWRLVVELDPQHASARRNLEQAERLLKGLEERRNQP